MPLTVQEPRFPDAAVPRAGVVSVGLVSVLLVNVSLPANVASVPVVGRVTLVAAVSVRVKAKLPEPVTVIAALLATPVPPLAAPNTPVTPVVRGRPVALVSSAAVGVPKFGVTRIGDVSTTNLVPVPVWEAIEVALPTDVITPVKLAFVTTVAAKLPVPLPVTPPVSVIV